MVERFRNKYRASTARLIGYDYSSSGAYFVTICTRKKIPYFGKIDKDSVTLSEVGLIVEDLWHEIPIHYPNVYLDEFVIMPDHIHGIILIKSKSVSNYFDISETARSGVSTKILSGNPYWKPYSLGSIINHFKRICTIKTKFIGLELIWQPRFYDHIIRSVGELESIRLYIKNNPKKYAFD
jgi:putative transposase